MMVEITTVICAMPPATTPGKASVTRRRISGVSCGRCQAMRIPILAAAATTTITCTSPERAMPQASATPAALWSPLPEAMKASSTAISTTLSSVGAKAATAKRP